MITHCGTIRGVTAGDAPSLASVDPIVISGAIEVLHEFPDMLTR